ncbi:general secretion pathway protein I [Tamilnaduibacter salinus]|uniref:Type II secretion system protein I n=1 Tax=Tamilnaduibacter salinus TaxID=1484056 RepID=A0A2U1CZ86_9GAMM|nr:type II secretion system minor pseudopilin GspI [Tamilnaduibacter salinus]PVY78106.1 general secretion pathway protein I [Tamilnaduibacter salinus]
MGSATAPSAQHGFTLIEVLVAVLIFGLIATTVSEVASNYIGSFERVRDKTRASWIAQNRMAELHLAENYPSVSEKTDELTFGNTDWEIDQVVSATQEPRIRRIELTVYRLTSGDRWQELTLTGFVGDF